MAGVKPLLETIGALLPKGIKAWHASPHDFDKVDLSKIGTGQGAQSYGPGFYAAESPKVSGVGGEYWREFARHPKFEGDPAQKGAIGFVDAAGGDRAKAIEESAKNLEANKRWLTDPNTRLSPEERAYIEKLTAERQASHDLLVGGGQVGPRVYELNLKADPQSFLQWDEPLAAQPHITEKVPQLLDAARAEAQNRAYSATSRSRQDELYDMVKNPEQATGSLAMQSWYRVPGNLLSGAGEDRGVASMNALRDAGIPGVRYADAASRTPTASGESYRALERARIALHEAEQRGTGSAREIERMRQAVTDADAIVRRERAAFPRTYNYVINNPDIIEIMRKLAIPGMVTGGAATAYQPQGQQ